MRNILVHHDNDVIHGVVSTKLRSLDEAFTKYLDRWNGIGDHSARLAGRRAGARRLRRDRAGHPAGRLPERVEAYVQLGAERSVQLDDLPGGPLPDPTWIALAEHGEASGAEPAELRQTTFGQSAEDWTVEYAVTLAVL